MRRIKSISDDPEFRHETTYASELNFHYQDLVAAFGEPGSDGDGYKTDAEWYIEFEGGLRVVIYNYKNGPAYMGSKVPTLDSVQVWSVAATPNHPDRHSALNFIIDAVALGMSSFAERIEALERDDDDDETKKAKSKSMLDLINERKNLRPGSLAYLAINDRIYALGHDDDPAPLPAAVETPRDALLSTSNHACKRLAEMRNQMVAMVEEAKELLQNLEQDFVDAGVSSSDGISGIRARAESYWMAHIESCASGEEGNPYDFSIDDTIAEIKARVEES